MTDAQDRMEIQRVINLVQGFGWSVVKQEFTDEDIIIDLKKKRTASTTTPEPGAG